MKYDVIIAGAGAAGLFAAANIKLKPGQKGLILNRVSRPGIKLLMSGAGQCNLTHAGDIKDFLTHYGRSGKRIRTPLYSFSNHDTIEWFRGHGLPIIIREDGKVFPKSLSAKDVLDLLTQTAEKNGFMIINDAGVSSISPGFKILTNSKKSEYQLLETRILMLAGGGASYPASGSDASLTSAASSLELDIIPCKPSLVPINVEAYPFTGLSGYSVKSSKVYIYPGKDRPKKAPCLQDDILFTHKNLSGPGILNMSRYAENGRTLEICWLPDNSREGLISDLNNLRSGNRKNVLNVLKDYFSSETFSDAFLTLQCVRTGIDPSLRFSDLPKKQLTDFINLLLSDKFVISGNAGWNNAMSTAGGISLDEINFKDMNTKKFEDLYIAGEMLDIDGDTGGYNLQFAFSSAFTAASSIQKKL